MNVKAFLKTVGFVSLMLGYVALIGYAAYSGNRVFLAIVLAPIVLLAIVMMFVSSYEHFKEKEEQLRYFPKWKRPQETKRKEDE